MKRVLANKFLSGIDLGAVMADLHAFIDKYLDGSGADRPNPFAGSLTDLVVDGDKATGTIGRASVALVRVEGRWYFSLEPEPRQTRGRRNR